MKREPIVVGSCLFGLAVSFAPIFSNTLPIFLKPIAQEFAWSRTQLAAGVSIATLSIAVFSPFLGKLLDRVGAQKVIAISAAAFALLVATFGILPPVYPLFLLLAAMIGIAATGTTPLAYLSVLPQWFDKRLGLALGIAMVGIGSGYAITPLLANSLMSAFGWREAYFGLAIVALLGVPNALLFLRDNPLKASGASALTRRRSKEDDIASGLTVREATASTSFWYLSVAVFLLTTVLAGCAVHLVALLSDRGFTPAQGAQVASALGLVLLVARLASGYLLDRIPAAIVGFGSFLAGALGIALLWSGAAGSVPFIAAALLGIAQGAEGDLMAYIVRRYFGMRSYSAIYGLIFAAFNLGALIGPLAMGISFDHIKSYDPALLIFIFAALAASLLMLGLGRPRFAPSADAPALLVPAAKS